MKKISTKNMSREEWLAERKKGIGGSDAGAILGLNPWKSAMSVYLDKITPPEEKEDFDNERMRQGRDLEDYVAKRFEEATGKKVRRVNQLLISEEHPFMIANIDRDVVGEDAGLECKTTSAYNKTDFENGEVPEQYYCQCQHYMAVTGADKWYLAVAVLGKSFHIVEIPRNEDDINALITAEERFWNENVLAGKEPAPDGSADADEYIKQKYPRGNGETIKLFDIDETLLPRYEEIKKLIAAYETEKKAIEQHIKLKMGEAERGEYQNYVVSWKPVTSNRLDTKRIKAEQPRIYEQYKKESVSRRFEIKEMKGE